MSGTRIIARLGHQGDGVAEGPLFAPYTLPGEEVSGVADGQTLRDVKILTPSPDRVKPACRHFPACGGCKLQHASAPFLAEWKTGIVHQALQAHGLSGSFLPMHVSPAQSRRRAVVKARRTKKGAMVGFHAPASDVIVETPDCQLLHPDLMAAFPAAAALARLGASRKHALSVMLTLSAQGVDVLASVGKPLEPQMRIELAALAEKFDLARLTWDDEPIVTRRPPEQIFGRARVTPPPGAFLQATMDGQAALQADVRAHVAGAKRVVDLFAGCGTFALDLAFAHEVHAVEGDAAMMRALDQAWRKADGLRLVSHEARDLFRRPLMPDELSSFDAAVLDPPRAGAEAQVAELAQAQIPVVAYVSCNPVSFARDAAHLVQNGYEMTALRVVDQFKWSAHVEIVSKFQLRST
ncbi:class I SAM-dependent RNA methyltransferase [Roseovarius faecimaris]|uniref:Class I SAM-dependent RNA methyltransferase n=1 Tax=Roseovarius faecimaris TaxID=2494550 RepID=A0A6I6ISC4_9RHOB|nr:class I SAM-dependent RNA methyltransferase [Roseovarius faecimaris]QGY00121.1 class I SAM-dependent RNA methyltransferase [Roseovarius faecimaris]